jgi:hypothetical protein
MFRRKTAQQITGLIITDRLVEVAAQAIQASKYKGGTIRPATRPCQPTEHDRRYARAALEAVAAYQETR